MTLGGRAAVNTTAAVFRACSSRWRPWPRKSRNSSGDDLAQNLRDDPFREDIHCLVMRAQAALGNRVAVKEQYEILRGLLQKELGSSPPCRRKRPIASWLAANFEPDDQEGNCKFYATKTARSPVRICSLSRFSFEKVSRLGFDKPLSLTRLWRWLVFDESRSVQNIQAADRTDTGGLDQFRAGFRGGLTIIGANGITVSGADGILYTGTNGITVSGAEVCACLWTKRNYGQRR